VLFNGLNVGSVKAIDFLEKDPSRVAALVDVAGRTPIKTDTKARLELQGLTGVAAIALTGGAESTPSLEPGADGAPPTINAEPSQLQNLLETVQRLSVRADDLIGKANKLIDENGPAITDTLANADTFSKALADNSSGVNAALKGVADLGRTIAPLTNKLQSLSDDVDSLVKAVNVDQVRGIIDKAHDVANNVDAFSATLARNSASVDSLLADTAALAKKLNQTAGQLDGALADFRGLAKAIDTKKIGEVIDGVDNLVSAVEAEKVRGAINNLEAFSATLANNKDHVDSLLADAATLAKKLTGTADQLDGALGDVRNLAKAIDNTKVANVVDRVDGIVGAVDPDKVRGAVDNVQAFSATLANNKDHVDSLLADAATLAKKLPATADQLDGALGDFRDLAKAVDQKKIAGIVDDASKFAEALGENQGNVDRALKNASELAAKLNNSADRLDELMVSAQNFLGSPETKGAVAEVGDAARSVRQFADDLNQRTKDIAVGLTRFSGSGLREYEALAIDARRTIGDLDHAIRSFERSPNQLIFGSKPALPEFHGGQ
jgi:phospholipid/cholesterol/gamma-HCH transport system substrate-binding protein